MFFMSLNIVAKFSMDIMLVVEMLSSHEIQGRKGRRYTIQMWEGIGPEYGISKKSDKG